MQPKEDQKARACQASNEWDIKMHESIAHVASNASIHNSIPLLVRHLTRIIVEQLK